MQAALTVRRHWPEKTVTLIDAEQEIGYYRTLLPQFMVRTLAERKLFFWRAEDDPQLIVISGVKVTSLDRLHRRIYLGNSEVLHYERLVVASGGRPIMPPVCPQVPCTGVFPVRSLTVARNVRKWLPDHPQVTVLGGGLVGVKTAIHLAQSNITVTLVEKEDQLLPQALSPQAAALVESHVARKNIHLYLGATVDDMRFESGALSAIQVTGEWLPCRTLLVAAGSLPEVDFLQDSGLLQDGKLTVTPALQTCDQNIYAAGDAVTIIRDGQFTPWTWPQAAVQGKLAALNLYRSTPMPLNCLSRVNCMNLKGLSLVVLGVPCRGAKVVAYADPAAGIYRELFLVDGKIAGGALVGDISNAGRLHAMMNSGHPAEEMDENFLKPAKFSFDKDSASLDRPRRRAVIMSPGGF